MAKRGGFPGGGMPGNMAKFNEAGSEDARSRWKSRQKRWKRKVLQQLQVAEL